MLRKREIIEFALTLLVAIGIIAIGMVLRERAAREPAAVTPGPALTAAAKAVQQGAETVREARTLRQTLAELPPEPQKQAQDAPEAAQDRTVVRTALRATAVKRRAVTAGLSVSEEPGTVKRAGWAVPVPYDLVRFRLNVLLVTQPLPVDTWEALVRAVREDGGKLEARLWRVRGGVPELLGQLPLPDGPGRYVQHPIRSELFRRNDVLLIEHTPLIEERATVVSVIDNVSNDPTPFPVYSVRF